MNAPVYDRLLGLLNRLDDARIRYTLRHSRYDAIMVNINVPGERWEVEFLPDGDVDVEVFRGNGEIRDESALDALIATHASSPSDSSPVQNPSNGAVLNK